MIGDASLGFSLRIGKMRRLGSIVFEILSCCNFVLETVFIEKVSECEPRVRL